MHQFFPRKFKIASNSYHLIIQNVAIFMIVCTKIAKKSRFYMLSRLFLRIILPFF